MAYEKIFVGNHLGIGDVILSTPVLRALKEMYVDSKMILLVPPNAVDVVTGLPFIDEVITYDKKRHGMLQVVCKIWRADIALCLDHRYRTAVMAFLARIPVRAGIKEDRGIFMTRAIEDPPDMDVTYQPYNFANIIKRTTGINLSGDFTKLHFPNRGSNEIKKVEDLLNSCSLAEKPFVVIAPFTSWPPKDWPVYYYQQLISALSANGLGVVLVGGQDGYDRAKALEGVVNFIGLTNLRETAEIISRAKLLVGGCSVNIHIAAALGTPVVGLYGPTSPARWAPKKKCIALSIKTPCSPCLGIIKECEHHTCMSGLSVERVFAACISLLEGGERREAACDDILS